MRIAHLSDLHLRHHLPGSPTQLERQSRRMPDLLAEAMAIVRAEAPDLLVVSGDLVDYPLDDPERQAEGAADLRLTGEILAAAACPCLAIPGNHDHAELALAAFHPVHDQALAGHRVLSFPEDHEDDHHVPHRRGPSLARFRRALSASVSLPQIHVQHYLVWPERNDAYPHTYADAEAMTQAITGSGIVRLVLSGHYHRGIAPFLMGETTFAVVPAFCVAPHPVWIYDLDEQGVAWRATALQQ